MHVFILPAHQCSRLPKPLSDKIGEIVATGQPTLICFNQMSRYLDWWPTAQGVDDSCAQTRATLLTEAPRTCGALEVWFTEFVADAKWLKQRNIKDVEDVSALPIYCNKNVASAEGVTESTFRSLGLLSYKLTVFGLAKPC